MVKLFFIIALLVLPSCVNSTKYNDEFTKFLDDRNTKNNLTILGIDNTIINTVIPNNFNSYPEIFQRNAYQIMLDILPTGQTLDNFDKSITVVNIIVDPKIFNMDSYLSSFEKSMGADRSCDIKDSKFEIVKKFDDEAIYILKCGKLVDGKMEEKTRNQGEVSLFRSYLKNNQFITIIYNFRTDSFDINEANIPPNDDEYDEFYKLTKDTIICSKNEKSDTCKMISSIKPNDFKNISYSIPNGYKSDRELAKRYKVDDLLIESGKTIETTKRPIVIIKYFAKNDRLKNNYINTVARVKSSFKNCKTTQFQVNNLDLYRTAFISSGIVIPNQENDKNIPDSFDFLYIETKNKFILVQIAVDDEKEMNSKFTDDFIKSIRLNNIE